MFLVEQSGQMLPVKDPQSQSECPTPRDSFGSANTEPAQPHAVKRNNLSSLRTSGQKRFRQKFCHRSLQENFMRRIFFNWLHSYP